MSSYVEPSNGNTSYISSFLNGITAVGQMGYRAVSAAMEYTGLNARTNQIAQNAISQNNQPNIVNNPVMERDLDILQKRIKLTENLEQVKERYYRIALAYEANPTPALKQKLEELKAILDKMYKGIQIFDNIHGIK